jgi:hypothetical protein
LKYNFHKIEIEKLIFYILILNYASFRIFICFNVIDILIRSL